MKKEYKCPKCGNDIDPTTCWCGEEDSQHGHSSNHSFTPQGCTCHFTKTPEILDPREIV